MSDDSPQGDPVQAEAVQAEAVQADGHATAQAPADPAGPEATEPDADAKPEIEDVKRKFREALDRKRQASSADTAGAGGKGKGKAQSAHGPASTRRSFRRKSG